MTIYQTDFPGLILIQPAVFFDQRGFFFESYQLKRFEENELTLTFVQDNFSGSSYGTVRGLHYQTDPFAQGKLCQVLLGAVWDVAVDLRRGSPTFGKHFAVELNDKERLQVYIPPGFAHGFSVLSETAIFHYNCTIFYNKQSERTLKYNDPELGIDWKIS